MFDEEESQERFGRSDTCQRQEGNGKATHGQVGKNSGTEPRSPEDGIRVELGQFDSGKSIEWSLRITREFPSSTSGRYPSQNRGLSFR